MPTIQEVLFTFANNVVTGIPALILAILWLLLGYVAGQVVYKVVKEILVRVKFDEYLAEKEKLRQKFSDIFSMIAKWVVYLVFVPIAVEFLGIPAFTALVTNIIRFLFGVIQFAIVIIVGYITASYIKDRVISSKSVYGNIVGQLIFFLTVYVSIALALPFLGIDPTIIQWILLVIIGSLGVGVAIALGWGLKDVVSELAKDYVRKLKR